MKEWVIIEEAREEGREEGRAAEHTEAIRKLAGHCRKQNPSLTEEEARKQAESILG